MITPFPNLSPEEVEARLRSVNTWNARGYYMDLSEHPTMSIQQLRELALLAADALADLRRQLDEAQALAGEHWADLCLANERNDALMRAGERAGEEIVGLTTALRLAEQALEVIAGKRQGADNLMSHVDVARAALLAPGAIKQHLECIEVNTLPADSEPGEGECRHRIPLDKCAICTPALADVDRARVIEECIAKLQELKENGYIIVYIAHAIALLRALASEAGPAEGERP